MRKTYVGACHCGAVRFEVEADIDHVRVCDCSVCAKRGALLHRVEPDSLRLLSPMERLQEYRWGTRTGVDYFCRVCGILPFRKPSHPSPAERASGAQIFAGWAVNTRCLEGFDPASVPIVRVPGATISIEQS